jgi:hypothetical protein
MKKIIFSIALSILAICGLFAQNNDVKFGIRGGLNLPNIMAGGTNTPVSEGYTSRLASGAGIFTELQINQTVSFRFGVEYSGMGGKKEGMQALPTQRLITEMGMSMGMGISEDQLMALGALAGSLAQYPYYYANVENTVKFDYVMIPLMLQFGWDLGQSPFKVYVNAGPFVSFLLSGKQVAKGTSKFYADASGTATLWDNVPNEAKMFIESQFPDIGKTFSDEVTFGETNITGELKSANFGIIGNVGLRYQYKRSSFFIEGGGNYGLITVQQDDANGSNRIGAASVMLGYAF